MNDILDDNVQENSFTQFFSVARIRKELRTYYLLLGILVFGFVVAVLLLVATSQPMYTATAIVGPADKSDDPLAQGLGGAIGSSIGGIAKHLHVGGMLGQQGSDDAFDEYSSLLTSNRLAGILVRKDHILPEIFSRDWDAAQRRWLPHNDTLHRSINWAKTVLRRPVKTEPDQDDLQKYFERNLIVDPSLETSFATVSFRFSSRDGAERLLSLILHEADNIIREDKRRDVAARIAYLNTALEHLSLADQKPQLIDILSDQQQEMMMIESDHLYASTLIDTPYASSKPSSPSPIKDGAIAVALAFISWFLVVRIVPAEGRWARALAAFARPRRKSRSPASRERRDPLAEALKIPSAIADPRETSPRSAG